MPDTPIPAASDRVTLLSDQDLYLFNEGSNYRLYETMGAHLVSCEGKAGVVFGVWAPNARQVSVMGNFNNWDPGTHLLAPRGGSGIWEGFVPAVTKGALYKFHIESRRHSYRVDKAGIVHCTIGKASFEVQALKENLSALIADLQKAKPSASKGQYLKRVALSSTMGPGVVVDQATIS